MLPLAILWSVLLTAQDPAPALVPPSDGALPLAGPRPAPTEAELAALSRYEALKDKVANTAAAHWKMAQWCEQNGLKPESYFHYSRVIELDPKRELAWQKLGFKKHDGRWMTADQIVADDAQKQADKDWSVKLKRWHRDLHGKRRLADAEATQAAIDAIDDPAAVPSVYREFCGGSSVDQAIGVQILGQIRGPIASKVIATLAVYGKSPAVRRTATETLRSRPAEEFLDMLVGLMKDLIRYETRPVGGPGSPGVLFVEGERFNARRFYAPPTPPSYTPRPGDQISYDANGLPVVTRNTVVADIVGRKQGVPGSKVLVSQTDTQFVDTQTYNIGAAYSQAQQAAKNAQAQLAADVAQLESINTGTKNFNELVMGVAQSATGKNPGITAKEWRDLLAQDRDDRYTPKPRIITKPTFDQMVPLAYLPNLAATMTKQLQTRFITQYTADT